MAPLISMPLRLQYPLALITLPLTPFEFNPLVWGSLSPLVPFLAQSLNSGITGADERDVVSLRTSAGSSSGVDQSLQSSGDAPQQLLQAPSKLLVQHLTQSFIS